MKPDDSLEGSAGAAPSRASSPDERGTPSRAVPGDLRTACPRAEPPAEPRRSRTAVVVALSAVVGLVVTLISAGHFLTEGPRFCAARCHADTIAAEPSEHRHAELECQTCHVTTVRQRLQLGVESLFGTRDRATPHGSLDERICKQCHNAAEDTDWELTAATQGHRVHASGPGQTGCLECHGADEHQRGAAMQSCTECHAGDRSHRQVEPEIANTADDPDRCLSCHAFTGELTPTVQPTVTECGRCHGEEAKSATEPKAALVVTADILHGEVACQLCHNPHGHDRQAEQGGHDCSSCHDIETVGEQAPAGHRVCESCHEPHAPHRDAVVSCEACHTEGAKRPPTIGGTATERQHDACSSCHLPHRWTAQRAGCVICHQAESATLLARAPVGHDECTQCHEPHGGEPTRVMCIGCHQALAGHLSQAPPSHRDCSTCHLPHAATSLTGHCEDCHGAATAELRKAPSEAHQKLGCRDCHAVHGSSPTATSCERCHPAEQQAASSAPAEAHQRCVSCHPAHGFGTGDPQQNCSGCHRELTGPGHAHRGECLSCHAAHGSRQHDAKACARCHSQAAPRTATAGVHGDCSSCHQPHDAAAASKGQCTSCHAKAAADTQAWRTGSPHSASCQSCHPAHDVARTQSCQSCHVTEGTQARRDRHRCTQCHSAHQPPAADPAHYWTDCERCHATQAAQARSLGVTHRRCANCHQPHSFQSPGCTSAACHSNIASLGAHATAQHRDCARCHQPHRRTKVGRQPCLDCHTDLRDHEPDAPRCQACHPFD